MLVAYELLVIHVAEVTVSAIKTAIGIGQRWIVGIASDY